MATFPESAVYKNSIDPNIEERAESLRRLGVSVLAAVSALAGGIAAAWVYRKTLTQLQQAESAVESPRAGTLGRDDDGDDL